MSAKKKETGEQKLLRLIEEQGGDAPAVEAEKEEASGEMEAAAVATSVKGLGLPGLNLPPALEGLFSGLRSGSGRPSFGMREVNNLLLAALMVVCLLFVWNIVNGLRYTRQEIAVSRDEGSKGSMQIAVPSSPDVSLYLSLLEHRNIFQPYEKKVVEKSPDEAPEAVQITALTKNLRLVGISSVEDEGAPIAMIEDTVNGITHFVAVGESIDALKVKAIRGDEVILGYKSEEMMMNL